MSAEGDIYGLLTDVPAVAAVTGNVYADMLPDRFGASDYPATIYGIDLGEEETALDGPGDLHHIEATIVLLDHRSHGRATLASAAETIRSTLHAVSRATLEGWRNAGYIDGTYSGCYVRTGPSGYDQDAKTFSQELYLTLHFTT